MGVPYRHELLKQEREIRQEQDALQKAKEEIRTKEDRLAELLERVQRLLRFT